MNDNPSTRARLVVVAASAGGLVALETLLGHLPADFPAPLIAVLHLSPNHRSKMAEVLGRYTDLRVKQAEEEDTLTPGTVYCAPPDVHVLVTEGGTLRLTQTAQVRYVRPSADVLFESAAEVYGERVVAVVLSGTGRDGADGVRAIKAQGGLVMAQKGAAHAGMPGAAIETDAVDWVLPLDEVAARLISFSNGTEPADKTTQETP